MRRLLVSVVATIAAALTVVACAPAPAAPAPPSAPTQASEPAKAAPPPAKAPQEPAKAAQEATKAPAAQPTTATAAKVDYPEKGKTITIVVPFTAGSTTDIVSRLLAAELEKSLGTPVQVANKPGAGGQTGWTEAVKSKADGYTLAMVVLPTAIATYMDPDRAAAYSRKDFAPVGNLAIDVDSLSVKANGPYKTLDDLVKAARANPGGLKVGDIGFMTNVHLDLVQLQRLAGVKFAVVHFDGAPQATTALLGDHVDAIAYSSGNAAPQIKSGAMKMLGIMSKQRSKWYPDVKTMEEQGVKLYGYSTRSIAAPTGTPAGIIEILSQGMKKASESEDLRKKMDESFIEVQYMDSVALAAYWAQNEEEAKPLIDLAKQQK